MTVPARETSTSEAAPSAPVVVHSGESQWSLIWREFRKRKLAVLSLGVIVLLVTTSVFAPFLANSKPLWYRGYNRFEYREAVRTALAVLNLLAENKTPAPAKPAADSTASSEEPVRKGDPFDVILDRQFDSMAANLRNDQLEKLEAVRAKAITLARAVQNEEGKAPAETLQQVRQLRTEIRRDFDSSVAPLSSKTHWPLIASLGWNDAILLTFNIALLLFPLWIFVANRTSLRERPGLRFWLGVFLMWGLPLVAGGLWKGMVPERLDRTPYKQGVASNHADAGSALVVYEDVVWAPIPFSVDEGNLNRKYLRPELMKSLPGWMLGVWSELPPEAPQAGEGAASSSSRIADRAPGIVGKPHWMGTDGTGRDILSRMIWGGRVSLSVGIVATAIEVVLGVILGALAGYFRGWVDVVISRIIEIVICFPSFFLILTIVAFVGPSIYNIMLVIGLTGWTGLARLVRGEFLRLSGQEFVLSAQALGYSPLRIIFRHVLPNAMAPVLVTATFAIAGAILTESGLSFLNLGITEPTPSWGGILSTGREALISAPWIIYFPGLAVFITITAYNLVGEAFRDAADPRLRGRM